MKHIPYEAKAANALREGIKLYDSLPELGCPTVCGTSVSYHFYGDDAKEELAKARRMLTIGKWDKQVTETKYILTSRLTEHVKISLFAERDQVCEQVVTGQVEVEEEFKVCPACEGNVGSDGAGGMVCLVNGRTDYYAPPLKTVLKTELVDKTDWVCSPVLSGPALKSVAS
jgi:hypothetical protein